MEKGEIFGDEEGQRPIVGGQEGINHAHDGGGKQLTHNGPNQRSDPDGVTDIVENYGREGKPGQEWSVLKKIIWKLKSSKFLKIFFK